MAAAAAAAGAVGGWDDAGGAGVAAVAAAAAIAADWVSSPNAQAAAIDLTAAAAEGGGRGSMEGIGQQLPVC